MTANLAELLARAAAGSPDRVALVDAGSGRRFTWGELDDAVSRVAAGLAAQGLVAGNRVVVATANRAEFVLVYLAVLRARLVAVPVNPRSATGELLRMVADSGARLIVADSTTIASARAVARGLHEALEGADPALRARAGDARLVGLDCAVEAGEVAFEDLLAAEPAELPEARDPESLAVLLYTSGTSGRPRAAMLSHRALLANLEQAAEVEPPMLGRDDVVYGVLPLFHVYGLNAVLGQVLRQQARLVVVDGFDPDGSLDEIAGHGVTVVPVAPPVLTAWRSVDRLRERLGGVRVLLSGSAPLSPELVTETRQATGLTVHQGYGLTEAAPVVTSTLCSAEGAAAAKPGSVGSPLPGVGLRLVDDTGAEPEVGDPGEIHIRGANLFDGYWPDAVDGPIDGWLATGDVGHLDADGDLFLVDRLKDLIIVSGFNVYPTEVEEAVRDVLGVLEVAVIGVPDEETGEAVVAYVRSDRADDDERAALADEVRKHCARVLARFKRPGRIEVVDELPLTVTGKVARGRLRATVRRRNLGLIE